MTDAADYLRRRAETMKTVITNLVRQKAAPPAGIDDYIAAVRHPIGELDGNRAGYFAFAYARIVEACDTIDEFPQLKFVSTLEKTTELLDMGNGPVLVIDLHLAKALTHLSTMFLTGRPPHEVRLFALRLLTEQFVAINDPAMAVHAALTYSIAYNDDPPAADEGQIEEHKQLDSIQQVFLLSHELAHIIWSLGRQPKGFCDEAMSYIRADGEVLLAAKESAAEQFARNFEKEAAQASQEARGKLLYKYLHVVVDFATKGLGAPGHIEAAIARRCGADLRFIEELWADFFGWTSCLAMFDRWAPEIVHRGVLLAIRNIEAIDCVRRVAESADDRETADDLAARKRIFLMLVTSFIEKARAEPGFYERAGLTEDHLAVDFMAMEQEFELAYNDVVWRPIAGQLFELLNAADLPSRGALMMRQAMAESRDGENVALSLLDEPVVNRLAAAAFYGMPFRAAVPD